MKKNKQKDIEDILPIIFKYTRKEAIEDGVLYDITELAKEAGFKIPVAITSAVESRILTITEEDKAYGQSRDGRLWDLLWMLKVIVMRDGEEAPGLIHFTVMIQDSQECAEYALKALCGPGDDAAPVITIMFPEED